MTAERVSDELRLVRLTPDDVRQTSDDYASFRRLVIENEPSYPRIANWLDGKVASGVRSQERVAYVAFSGENPAASAVVKLGTNAKFCHLRLAPHVRDRNLGELFFCLMALEVRRIAENVHFTLPQSLWADQAGFFQSFSFKTVERAKRQYRLFEEELRCDTRYSDLWRSVVNKLPALSRQTSIRGHSMTSALILSIARRYANAILEGRKSVEIRRRFSARWEGSRAVICSEKALVGEVTIRKVVCGEPESIWQQFSPAIGCTREEFDRYASGADRLTALLIDGVVPYFSRIPLVQLETLTGRLLVAPQSYCSAEGSESWSGAVAVAALLHGNIRSYIAHQPLEPSPSAQLRLL